MLTVNMRDDLTCPPMSFYTGNERWMETRKAANDAVDRARQQAKNREDFRAWLVGMAIVTLVIIVGCMV